MTQSIQTTWETRIKEYELDPSWKDHPIYKNKSYINYRKKWKDAEKGNYLGDFPLNIEIEPTYYCNLKCPMCPRMFKEGNTDRDDQHMSQDLWKKIITECKENKLDALQMAHEAESFMNPKLENMMEETTQKGIFDIWIHTNGLLLNETRARKVIKAGLKKINFSVDAFKDETFEKIRVGGKLEKLKKNILNFLKLKEEYKADYLRVRISFVEQKDNFSEKEDFFNFWSKQKGVNVITFQKCQDYFVFDNEDEDVKLSKKELESKYKNEKPFFCAAPWETPIIQEDGKITPCGMPVREHNKDFILGDISKGDTIKGSWCGEKMQKLRALHKKKEWYKENMCRVCVKMKRSAQHQEFKPNI